MSYSDLVREFHHKMNVPMPDSHTKIPFELFVSRHRMLLEEWEEYKTASTVVDIVDAFGDMIYVILGTMLIMGIDPDKVMNEIHKSNMTKKAENRASDGKILKDDDFVEPDLAKVLNLDDPLVKVI